MKARLIGGWGMIAAMALVGAASGCGGVGEELEPSDVASEQLAGGEDKADGLYGAATYTYYSVRHDNRRCAWPMCGGWWVRRVNLSTTKCANGSYQAECYVERLDLARLGTVATSFDATTGLLRGNIVSNVINGQEWGKFVGTEGWRASSGIKPIAGTFRRLQDNGIRCITFPCNTTHAARLNQAYHSNISGVDLSSTGASRREIDAAMALVSAPGGAGILAVGTLRTVPNAGPAGAGLTFGATQFYTRAR